MKKLKNHIVYFMIGTILIICGILPQKDIMAAEGDNYGISNPRVENGVTTWDKIKFGSYYQDAEFEPEPIKWRVLAVDGDDAFLLADKNLDHRAYNDKYEEVTWETCTLRKWLNEDFYNKAFDDDEKNAILETTVINNDNSKYGTDGGNDTKDKIYLLSIEEVNNAAYGFDSEHDDKRIVEATDYIAGHRSWWLRSPGDYSETAAFVVGYASYGFIDYQVVSDEGHNELSIDYDWPSNCAIRPVLHVNLSSSKVKDAGEVDSEGNVTDLSDGIKAPRIEGDITTWDCVYFGNYEQEAKFQKTDIEWRVLSVNGNDAFLLADKILDCRPYDDNYEENVPWEACMLRKWLNEDFYNEAFDDDEKNAILETRVINKNNGDLDKAENYTKDKIYIMSENEMRNLSYGFDTFYGDSVTREMLSTKYSEIKAINEEYGSLYYRWLRDEGEIILYGGAIWDSVSFLYIAYNGVQPALHIDLSSSSWVKSGEVSANNRIMDDIPAHEPMQKPDTPQGQPTETPVPPSTGIGNTPSAGNADTAVQPPAAAKILSAKNTKKGKVVIKWNKSADVNGYEIQYSNNMKFKKAKKKNTSNNKYTIKKLKKKKVYYIRLRAYKVVNGVKLYGSWSKPKKIKIKK